jgi:CubicO group peptidase (beta-lactamase class C family)
MEGDLMNDMVPKKKSWLRIIGRIIAILLIVIIGFAAWKSRELYRFYKVVTLFDEGPIVENFRTMSDIFPYHEIKRGGSVFEFIRAPQALPESFSYNGKDYNFAQLMKDTWTTGLIVIKNDRICFEEYYLGHNPDTLHISWSVGKSFVSALIGIAIAEGKIAGIGVPVSDLVPRLKGTGYDGVPLKDVLQMSSGVRFNEDYADFDSDINRMGRTIALGSSINEFAASLKSERKPGKYHHYVSMDTQILGMVLQEATGMTSSAYLEEKIWKKIGMQANARWLKDDYDMELVFGTLNVTLRDYARFGRLYMRDGNWNGEQVVPAQWVKDSITPDAPHLKPGKNPLSSSRMGYGYQWWIPENPKGDFMALGVHGQHIYVNPAKKVVIVKSSADPFWKSDQEINYAVTAGFQNIAEKLK